MTSTGKMAGQHVVVTGAGTGIGRGVGLRFAQEGATVVFHYSHSSAGADSAVAEVNAGGGRAAAIKADFRKFEAYAQLVKDARAFMGGIDVLVNNAGITMNVPIEEVTLEQYDTLFNVNIRAQIFLTQAVLPLMAAQGKGHIINVTSIHAYAGATGHPIYAATKGAIVSFTREVALEVIRKGVRVNAIAPGAVRVENQEQALGPDFDWDAGGKMLPTGFVAQPEDIGNVAIYLASDDSRYIIGQTIICDGGQTAIMALTGDFDAPRNVLFGRRYIASMSGEKV